MSRRSRFHSNAGSEFNMFARQTRDSKLHYHPKYLKAQWEGTDRSSYTYNVSVAPSDRSTCKACNKLIGKGELRLGRSTPNPFDAEGGATDYTKFFHPEHHRAGVWAH